MELTGYRRISDNKSTGMQFGNFKYVFKQRPLKLWDNTDDFINEVYISTCDNVLAGKITLNFRSAAELYGHLTDLIGWQDSFDQRVEVASNNEITRLYGWYDFPAKQYKLRIEKEQIFSRNTSVMVTSLDDEDVREFTFLFYFHFLISMME